jgi:integrase
MGVYKRPECEWKNGKPTWYFQFTVNKVKFYDGIYSTKKEAQDAEDAKRQELKSKRHKTIPIIKSTFAEILPRFIEHRRITRAARTVIVEDNKAKQLGSVFGKMLVSKISTNDINNYVADKKNSGAANRTVNLELTLLRSIFQFAIEIGVTDYNPAKQVKNLKEVRCEKWIPTKDELQRFVKCAAKLNTGKYLVPWIWFRAYTGTRPSESVFIEWKDIDFENDMIRICPKAGNELKNGKFRVVEMHSELKPILLEWKKEWQEIHDKWLHRNVMDRKRKGRLIHPDHDWVFIHPLRHGQRTNCFSKSLDQARRDAGLPEMTSHTLRHYFISSCVMSGINFFTIAKWVGHSNSRMIEEVYGHLNDGYRKEQMAMLKVV